MNLSTKIKEQIHIYKPTYKGFVWIEDKKYVLDPKDIYLYPLLEQADKDFESEGVQDVRVHWGYAGDVQGGFTLTRTSENSWV